MNCLQVARVLQSYVDGEADEVTARRVAAHLADCRRCGLEATVYQEIKSALARRQSPDDLTLRRLRDFSTALLRDPPPDDDSADGTADGA
ncbi:anti-sigma factor [Streptomyces sp. E11-3]|uniref:anti-sigma factor family protein n=1 Tax=Streptomyces sp. E11-3 TaxID=3110112 RepID=UPI0039817ACB